MQDTPIIEQLLQRACRMCLIVRADSTICTVCACARHARHPGDVARLWVGRLTRVCSQAHHARSPLTRVMRVSVVMRGEWRAVVPWPAMRR